MSLSLHRRRTLDGMPPPFRLALALAGALGVLASELDCVPTGQTDTTLNFEGKTVIESNLGGICSSLDADDRPASCIVVGDGSSQRIVFENVGVAGTKTSHPGSQFNLVVTNLTEYDAYDYQYTRIEDDSFAQINVRAPYGKTNRAPDENWLDDDGNPAADTFVKLSFCAELSDGTQVTLERFPASFYDLCAAPRAAPLPQPEPRPLRAER